MGWTLYSGHNTFWPNLKILIPCLGGVKNVNGYTILSEKREFLLFQVKEQVKVSRVGGPSRYL
jgi:hypothetical protein